MFGLMIIIKIKIILTSVETMAVPVLKMLIDDKNEYNKIYKNIILSNNNKYYFNLMKKETKNIENKIKIEKYNQNQIIYNLIELREKLKKMQKILI